MRTYRYIIVTTAIGSPSNQERMFSLEIDGPIETLLDDEKSYIRTPKGYLIMKHAIKLIQDCSVGITEA